MLLLLVVDFAFARFRTKFSREKKKAESDDQVNNKNWQIGSKNWLDLRKAIVHARDGHASPSTIAQYFAPDQTFSFFPFEFLPKASKIA